MNIYPSLISADLLNLQNVIETLNDHADGYHLDIMDDHFVPNLTWGPMFVNAIGKVTPLPLQVHAMVTNPQSLLDRLSLAEKDSFIFHWETCNNSIEAKKLFSAIKAKNIKAGIALNPTTPVSAITDLLPLTDEVLVMSVEPGFSGQDFIDVTSKVAELSTIRDEKKLSFSIGMDGGINEGNIASVAAAGVTFVGVASAIFSQSNLVDAMRKLKNNTQQS